VELRPSDLLVLTGLLLAALAGAQLARALGLTGAGLPGGRDPSGLLAAPTEDLSTPALEQIGAVAS
jgi:hypothetical protein